MAPDLLRPLRKLERHRRKYGISFMAGCPIYDAAVRNLATLTVPMTPYQAIDAGLVPASDAP